MLGSFTFAKRRAASRSVIVISAMSIVFLVQEYFPYFPILRELGIVGSLSSGCLALVQTGRRSPLCASASLKLPAIDQISSETPLRLAVAAAVIFPDGSLIASGLLPSGGGK